MNGLKQFARVLTILAATYALAQAPSSFQERTGGTASQVNPADLQNIGIDQRLNQQIPLDLEFKDETGKTVRLGDYFQTGRPVILNLVYYTCPMLCGEELTGEASALGMLTFTPGKEYEVVSVSFNPDETPKDAADKKKIYIARVNEHLDHKTDGSGWHFLTGQQPQIKQLADAVGFHYRRDPKTGEIVQFLLCPSERSLRRKCSDMQFVENRLLPRTPTPVGALPWKCPWIDHLAGTVHTHWLIAGSRIGDLPVFNPELIPGAGTGFAGYQLEPTSIHALHGQVSGRKINRDAPHARCPQPEPHFATFNNRCSEGHLVRAVHGASGRLRSSART